MSAVAGMERVRVRKSAAAPQGGGVFVPVLQRARLLDATISLVVEVGVRGLTVRRVTARAGMSSKTFYDLFADREECLLAAFDHALERFAGVVVPAYEGESGWSERARAGLGALLDVLDREPVLARFVFVEALACGPLVLERRARVLEDLAGLIDAHGSEGAGWVSGSLLLAEGAIGAVCGVIHARLLEPDRGPLAGLLNGLMAMVVLPYRGQDGAALELARAPLKRGHVAGRRVDLSCDRERVRDGDGGGDVSGRVSGSAVLTGFRPTVRTFTVLACIGADPGLNNREISDRAGVSDQGQISRLLWRLEDQGLVENTGGHAQGTPKAWSLTTLGVQALQAGAPSGARKESV
jgi:AcrR family transcriptional regulator